MLCFGAGIRETGRIRDTQMPARRCARPRAWHYGKGSAMRPQCTLIPVLHAALIPEVFDGFWARVDTSAGPMGCWRRAGRLDHNGYARFHHKTTDLYAHRFAFISIIGEPPPHLPFITHQCPGGGNRWCVNPSHLAPGTGRDNAADRARDGRTARGDRTGFRLHPELVPRGEHHYMAKLSASLVTTMRAERLQGSTLAQLAERYGVTPATISNICCRRAWQHIP